MLFGKAGAGLGLLAAAAIAASATQARAADPIPAPAAGVPSWTGAYIGVLLGGSFSNVQSVEDEITTGIGVIPELVTRFGDTEFNAGVYGGFNWQFAPRYVTGVEIDATFVNAHLGNALDAFPESAADIDSVVALTARLGFLATPETLIYLKAGGAFISGEANIGFAADPVDDTLVGGQVGVGVEALLTRNFAIRAEAAYTRAVETWDVDITSYRPEFLQARVGGAFKFGGGDVAAPVEPAFETNWTGFHLGGHIEGLGAFTAYSETFVRNEPFGDMEVGGGVQGGVDYAFHRFVVGVEGSATWTSLTFEDETLTGTFAEVDAIYAVTGRLGVLVTPSALLYAKGGAAWIRTSVTDEAAALVGSEGDDATLSGYQVGGGMEAMVASNVSLRVEGLYTRATEDIIFDGAQPEDFAVEPEILSLRVGASYRF
jgi:outer membrane immunogenic protein